MAQTKKPVDGFFGIKFGADSVAVKAAVLAKGGVLNEKLSEPGNMVFSNINYETWKNATLYVGLLENQVYKITLGIIKIEPENVFGDYKKIVKEINAVYGSGTAGSDKNTTITLWIDKNKNSINASTLSSAILTLTYKNNDLGPIGQRIP